MEALVSLRVDSAASALVELLQRPSDDDALAAATSGASLNSGRFIIAIAEILAKLRHRPALKPLTRLIDATDDAHRGLLLRCIARIDREHAIDLLDKRIRSRRREMPDRLNSLKILNDLQWPDKQQLLLSLYQRDSLNKPLRMVIGTYLLHYGNNENRSTVESLWKQSRDWEAIQYCQEHLPPMFVAQAAHQKILQLLKVRTGEAKSWNRLDLARLLSSNALIWRYVGQTERASLVKLYQHILTTIDEPLELRRTLLIWPWSPSDIWWLPNEILRSLRQVLHNGRDDEALRAAVAERLSCVGEIESTAENIAILIKLLDARLGAQLHRPAGSSDIDLEVAVSNVRLALCRVAPQRALELFQPWLLDAASIKLYETICGWFRGEYCDPTDTSDEFSVFGRRLDTLARLHGSSTDQTLGPPTDPPMEALSCPAYQAVWLAEDAEPYAWMSEVSKSADRIDSGEPRERWTLDEKGLEKEAMLWDEVGGLQLVVAMRILRARKEVLLRGAACLDNSDMLLGAQCFVAEVLGTRRILEAEDDLLRILSSSTAPLPLRGAAVRGLAHLATTRALQVLADTLRDSRAASQLRRTVAAAVGVLRVQALATEVRSLTLDCSTSLELRATTAAALAALERECDNALLLRVIHDQAMPVEIRAAVVRAGGGSTVICAPKTMALLAGQVTESPQLRAAAAAACIRQLSQEMSAPDAWKAIEQILRNTNSNTELEIRMALVYQMRHYPVEEAAAALANVVTTPDEPVSLRKASWKTLCTIASNAASQLVPAFYDRMRLLRHEVARAGLLDLGTMEAWQLLLDRGWDEDLSLNEKVAPSTLTIVEDQRKTLVEQHSLRLDPSLCPA